MGALASCPSLVSRACEGEADALFELGASAFWKYDNGIKGTETDDDAVLLLDAAGVAQSGIMADTIGDFYKYEFNTEKSQAFYAYGVLDQLEKAVNGDASACMALANKYAYGKGVEQNDQKAYFWCQAAADLGNLEAQTMLKNFWKSGVVLPASEEMSQSNDKKYPAPTAEVRNFKRALIESEAKQAYDDAAKRSEKLTKNYSFTNIAHSAKAHLVNPILDTIHTIIQAVGIAYIVATVITFIISYLFGYHESGLLHWINEGYALFLGIPLRLFLSMISDHKFADITTELLCDNFHLASWNIIVEPFRLACTLLAAAIWIGILVGIFFLITGIFCSIYVQGIVVTPESEKYPKTNPYEDSQYKKILEGTPVYSKFDPYIMMAAASVAQCNKTDIAHGMLKFLDIIDAKEECDRTPILEVAGDYSDMGLYFIIRHQFGMLYVEFPDVELPIKSDLSVGYRQYRRGENYAKAEETLQKVINAPNDEQSAWAKYFMYVCAKMYLSAEHLPKQVRTRRPISVRKSWKRKPLLTVCSARQMPNPSLHLYGREMELCLHRSLRHLLTMTMAMKKQLLPNTSI